MEKHEEFEGKVITYRDCYNDETDVVVIGYDKDIGITIAIPA